MQIVDRTAQRLLAFSVTAAVFLAIAGCLGTKSIKPPQVDPLLATRYAMDHYDANGDGMLEESELSRCPALAAARPAFDADADGRLAETEISDNLKRLFAAPMSLTEMTWRVTLKGRTLAGAIVRLHPIEMIGDALPAAEGVTDESGAVRPSIGEEQLPDEFRQMRLMYPGLYRVDITHPKTKIASNYNTATELGCLVDTSAPEAKSARFDLK